jgi:hypothetical protein
MTDRCCGHTVQREPLPRPVGGRERYFIPRKLRFLRAVTQNCMGATADESQPKKVAIVSLGCPKNTVDGRHPEILGVDGGILVSLLWSKSFIDWSRNSQTVSHRKLWFWRLTVGPPAVRAGEVILGDLYRSGFNITENHEEADAIIVNTCGFVEEAKTESIEVCVAVVCLHCGKARQRLLEFSLGLKLV